MKKSILMLVAGLASVALVGCGQKSSEAEIAAFKDSTFPSIGILI